ncbi:hypothetical protein BpHYR1_009336 [Brachionus plicatilis]|uniref:Uncharacterized protein n=1 Tax=Brachionus plicatilis TaxID=10195 RepID=A0A3M7PQP5_BRAPC|nr:hypothetical protein BpHYR1_009336 [Brachionus plicatilis]
MRPYWISRDIHHIENLTLCYCLRMLGKWVGFLGIDIIINLKNSTELAEKKLWIKKKIRAMQNFYTILID